MGNKFLRRWFTFAKLLSSLLATLALLFATQGNPPPATALAANGTPTPTAFGYGVGVDLNGPQALSAIPTAARMGLDWLAIDFDWAARWPDPTTPPNLETINPAMEQARLSHMSVMISIRNAPAWGLTPTGPDPTITANLVLSLARFYPDTLLALELFPAANTFQGWGAPPNPAAYTLLLQTASSLLQNDQRYVLLIAAGLTPPSVPGDMDDLAFLDGLYTSGAMPAMTTVSLRLPDLSGEPLTAPTPENPRVLRHYEEIRQVMLNHQHQQGLIWLTGFSWPSTLADPEQQSLWLSQAYQLLVAQLYIGAAFFQQINPAPDDTAPHLVNADLSQHPALQRLTSVILVTGSQTSTTPSPLHLKRLTNRPDFKPHAP